MVLRKQILRRHLLCVLRQSNFRDILLQKSILLRRIIILPTYYLEIIPLRTHVQCSIQIRRVQIHHKPAARMISVPVLHDLEHGQNGFLQISQREEMSSCCASWNNRPPHYEVSVSRIKSACRGELSAAREWSCCEVTQNKVTTSENPR